MKFKLLTSILLIVLLAGCFSRSDESKIKGKLKGLAGELSYDRPIPAIQLALAANRVVNFFHKELAMQVKVKTASFSLRKSDDLKQHIFTLRKMVPVLEVKFNNIKIIKDQFGYKVQTTILARGKDKKGEPMEEFLDYEFSFMEIEGEFLITGGKNMKVEGIE